MTKSCEKNLPSLNVLECSRCACSTVLDAVTFITDDKVGTRTNQCFMETCNATVATLCNGSHQHSTTVRQYTAKVQKQSYSTMTVSTSMEFQN